ncbi:MULTISPECIES: PAS and helix-turn-helix domain-containing protein [Pirellulaceae]|uniref:DNA-binding CsgD family transcriptional regulator n=1 Tax=Aporhodopirellula rubra TaxID=980271 RepID=A0A7W5H5U9_9BACT|nr:MULTISPECIES: PAS and helix-turn-helix domain-containing protein [Pirellulaceae]EMI41753.1 transcription regulator LuxR [Rhodopirellula sp. SWK7]MBB3207877.1 DNA-binding CsgD family transcriptional regulator [Aporhodopirellula rubra]
MSLWAAVTRTAGVGISITDAEGRLLFVNDTAMVLFSQCTGIDYQGKKISDFHSPEYAAERMAMIGRVLDEGKPLSITHVYHGKRIHSNVWPIRDKTPPYNRVIVISRTSTGHDEIETQEPIEEVHSEYIGLGALDVLTRRELEVAVLLGHGLSVPRVAKLLFRSPKTIERHKSSITQKLKLRGQSELVAMITEMGLDLDATKLRRLPGC